MDHSYFSERISGFLDRDLDPYDLRVVEEHLETCEECRELLNRLEKLDTFVEENTSLKDDEYWESSAKKIEAALDPEASPEITPVQPSSWKSLGWKLTAVAASIAALAFIGLYETELTDDFGDGGPLKSPVIIEKPTRFRRTVDSTQLIPRNLRNNRPLEIEAETEGKEKSTTSLQAPFPIKKTVLQEKSDIEGSAVLNERTRTIEPSDEKEGVASMDLSKVKRSFAPVFNIDEHAPLSLAKKSAGKTKQIGNFAAGDSPSLTGADESVFDEASLLLRRDSLLSNFRAVIVDSIGDVSKMLTGETASKSAAEQFDGDRSAPALKLLEVQYLIGKSTPNRSTYDSVLLFMDSLQYHGDTTISKQAANYLKILQERKDW